MKHLAAAFKSNPTRPGLRRRRNLLRCLALVLPVIGACDAQAQTPADFYAGKTVRVLAGFDAAGAAGFYVQLISAYLGKYIPGHPAVVPQFMPGGGSIVEANYIFAAAPRDGTVIGTMFDNLPTTQVLDPASVKFDAKRFTIIGALNKGENGAMAIRADSPVQTIEQAKTSEVMESVTGPGTTGWSITKAMNALLGTRFKIVMGYAGGNAMLRAFEQREVAAVMLDYNSLRRDAAALIDSGLMKFMFQVGDARDPRIADVPLLQEAATTKEQHDLFVFLSESRRLGKPIIAPPDLPGDRAKILRDAWQAMLRDPAFAADSEKLGYAVEPRPWENVAGAVRETIDVDPAIAKMAAGFSTGN